MIQTRVTLILFCLSTLPLPALAEPQAQQNMPCSGLRAGSNDLEKSLQNRQKLLNSNCSDGGPMAARLAKIKAQLGACKNLGKDLQGNTHAIPADALLSSLTQRLGEVCKVQNENVAKNKDLCVSYGSSAAKVNAYQAQIKSADTTIPSGANASQAAYVSSLQSKIAGVSQEYAGYQKAADEEGKRLQSALPEIKDAKDARLAQTVATMKSSINSYATYMIDQAKTQLADRQRAAAKTGDESGPMRWKTQRDVDLFWDNLALCQQVTQAGGLLDQYVAGFDKTLSASVEQAKKESGALSAKFQEMAGTSAAQSASMAATTKNLGSDISGTAAAQSAKWQNLQAPSGYGGLAPDSQTLLGATAGRSDLAAPSAPVTPAAKTNDVAAAYAAAGGSGDDYAKYVASTGANAALPSPAALQQQALNEVTVPAAAATFPTGGTTPFNSYGMPTSAAPSTTADRFSADFSAFPSSSTTSAAAAPTAVTPMAAAEPFNNYGQAVVTTAPVPASRGWLSDAGDIISPSTAANPWAAASAPATDGGPQPASIDTGAPYHEGGLTGAHSSNMAIPSTAGDKNDAAANAAYWTTWPGNMSSWDGYSPTGKSFTLNNNAYTEWCKGSTCYYRQNHI